MNANQDSEPTFASETAIFRIVTTAKIVSWVMLAFYAISWLYNDLIPLFQGQTRWPTQVSQWPMAAAGLFYAPVLGMFYFLILQAVAYGLNLGLDIYYDFQPEEEEETEETDETGEGGEIAGIEL